MRRKVKSYRFPQFRDKHRRQEPEVALTLIENYLRTICDSRVKRIRGFYGGEGHIGLREPGLGRSAQRRALIVARGRNVLPTPAGWPPQQQADGLETERVALCCHPRVPVAVAPCSTWPPIA